MSVALGERCPVEGAAVWDIDPYSDEVLADLESWYAGLRERGPLVWLSRYGCWAVGRYAPVREVFGDWKRFCSSRGVGLADFKTEKPWRPPSIILEADPPEHEKARKAMTRALSPRAVGAMREAFEAQADILVDSLLARGEIDMVRDFAEVYPLSVFPDAVGLAREDRRNLLIYGAMVFNSLGPDNAVRRRALADAADVVPWIMQRCRREALVGPGFGEVIYTAADDGEITIEEAGLLVRSFLTAGIDTTVAGLGAALKLFSENPDQFDLLREDPARARPAFEEVLRMSTPVHAFFRTANQDTEIAGVPVAEGAKLMCVLGAANLDADRFEQPERFDILRKTTGHLGFGTGIHGCVGQAVARLEGEVILAALAKKVGRIEPLEPARWRPGNALRTLEHGRVRFHSPVGGA